MIGVVLVLIAILFASLYIWQKQLNSYWARHNVKYIKPSFLMGNMKELVTLKQNVSDQIRTLYNTPEFKDEPLVGIYAIGRPALLVRDVELIKRLLIKDFTYFSDRYLKADPHHDPLGKYNLFFIRNPEWKDLRTRISPVFTSGKIKQIYPLMQEVGGELETYLEKNANGVMEMKNLCARFTTDLIANVAFGIKANAVGNPDSVFFKQFTNFFELSFKRFLEIVMFLLIPECTRIFRLKLFPKPLMKYLHDTMNHIINEREKNGVVRNDLIDTLIDMKRKAAEEGDKSNLALNFDYLVAQSAVFQTAGFETSSNAMCFALYELARFPEMQDRLRAEIRQAAEDGNGEISYNALHEMTYLNQVVDETLRKYPSLAFLERECTLPKGSDGYSLEPYVNFKVPNGMPIYISLIGMQRDEKYWPDPEQFDPDRFAPENRGNINKDAYMPFGIGPHNCIGTRIGLMQTKLGLVHLLKNYRASWCDETPTTIRFDPKSFNIANIGGMYLRIERIEN